MEFNPNLSALNIDEGDKKLLTEAYGKREEHYGEKLAELTVYDILRRMRTMLEKALNYKDDKLKDFLDVLVRFDKALTETGLSDGYLAYSLLQEYVQEQLEDISIEKKALLINYINETFDAAFVSDYETHKLDIDFGTADITPAYFLSGTPLYFGHFPQTSDLKIKPIEWEVLGVENGEALLFSKYALISKRYGTSYTESWLVSDIRKYLNGEFYNTAFNEEEKTKIQPAVYAPAYEPTNNDDVKHTDKVTLLDMQRFNEYIEGKAGKKRITEYALSSGIEASLGSGQPPEFCYWWLRDTCGRHGEYAQGVNRGGKTMTHKPDYKGAGVLPVIWLKVEDMRFKSDQAAEEGKVGEDNSVDLFEDPICGGKGFTGVIFSVMGKMRNRKRIQEGIDRLSGTVFKFSEATQYLIMGNGYENGMQTAFRMEEDKKLLIMPPYLFDKWVLGYTGKNSDYIINARHYLMYPGQWEKYGSGDTPDMKKFLQKDASSCFNQFALYKDNNAYKALFEYVCNECPKKAVDLNLNYISAALLVRCMQTNSDQKYGGCYGPLMEKEYLRFLNLMAVKESEDICEYLLTFYNGKDIDYSMDLEILAPYTVAKLVDFYLQHMQHRTKFIDAIGHMMSENTSECMNSLGHNGYKVSQLYSGFGELSLEEATSYYEGNRYIAADFLRWCETQEKICTLDPSMDDTAFILFEELVVNKDLYSWLSESKKNYLYDLLMPALGSLMAEVLGKDEDHFPDYFDFCRTEEVRWTKLGLSDGGFVRKMMLDGYDDVLPNPHSCVFSNGRWISADKEYEEKVEKLRQFMEEKYPDERFAGVNEENEQKRERRLSNTLSPKEKLPMIYLQNRQTDFGHYYDDEGRCIENRITAVHGSVVTVRLCIELKDFCDAGASLPKNQYQLSKKILSHWFTESEMKRIVSMGAPDPALPEGDVKVKVVPWYYRECEKFHESLSFVRPFRDRLPIYLYVSVDVSDRFAQII